MDPYRYVLRQRSKDGILWTSPDVFVGDYSHVCQAVIGGWLSGHARWAETAETGMFIFGLDSAGKKHTTGTTHYDFSGEGAYQRRIAR